MVVRPGREIWEIVGDQGDEGSVVVCLKYGVGWMAGGRREIGGEIVGSRENC